MKKLYHDNLSSILLFDFVLPFVVLFFIIHLGGGLGIILSMVASLIIDVSWFWADMHNRNHH